MSRTTRTATPWKAWRTPRFRWKLFAGVSPKAIIDDWADKPVAARKEYPRRRSK